MGVAGIAATVLLDAAPSKAVLYIDFIPSPANSSHTRIKASGTINPSLLATSPTTATVSTGTGASASQFNRAIATLKVTYGSPAVSNAGRRYAITPNTDPFTGGGNFNQTGATPANNPPLWLRLGTPVGSTPTWDIWLPDSFTGGASPTNSALAVDGFFDVNSALTSIGLASSTIVFTSGTEQIILRYNPAQTPGPVPLLGAAAAFGYSRKLRNRIQKSIPARLA